MVYLLFSLLYVTFWSLLVVFFLPALNIAYKFHSHLAKNLALVSGVVLENKGELDWESC